MSCIKVERRVSKQRARLLNLKGQKERTACGDTDVMLPPWFPAPHLSGMWQAFTKYLLTLDK